MKDSSIKTTELGEKSMKIVQDNVKRIDFYKMVKTHMI